MKKIAITLLVTVWLHTLRAADHISPDLGVNFGTVVSLEVEFVEKPNTYIDQNLIKTPFLARILVVNGEPLKTPVNTEYISDYTQFEKNRRYHLKGYETIYTLGEPPDWEDEPSQIDYHIRHKVFLRGPTDTIKQ